MPLKKGSADHLLALSAPAMAAQAPENSKDELSSKSAYELEREANIRRNDQLLAAIGLADSSAEQSPSNAGTPQTTRKRGRARQSEPEIQSESRRSLRMSSAASPPPSSTELGRALVAGVSSSTDMEEGNHGVGSRTQKRARRPPPADAEDDTAEQLEEEQELALLGRPPSSHEFARIVLRCIRRIPVGKVASYGQLAAMAGLPRNARQVGSMLKEGLCNGGMPWWRVINSAGKISLPGDGGGGLQRRKLEAEGVRFTGSGAVENGTFWEP